MTSKEIASLIRRLKAYYPYWYKGITAEEANTVIEVWQLQFKDFDFELLEMVVDEWGSKNTAPPSIVELKSCVASFYHTFSFKHNELEKNANADPKEVKKYEKWKELAWKCMGCSIKK